MNDLGQNVVELVKRAQSSDEYKVFVDIGIRDGNSSNALLTAVELNDGNIFGIDIANITQDFINHSKYTFIQGESIEIVQGWKHSKVDVIFIDTTHVDSYVLCELYYWWDLLNTGGFIAFHDTEWDTNHRDMWCGKSWGHVSDGLKIFFGISSLDYADDYISVDHFPASYGMTFITKKKHYDFKSHIDNWDDYFKDRDSIINDMGWRKQVGLVCQD